MNHISYKEWLTYVQNKLDDELREEYENHLYSCDHCLELYLQAAEATESQLPELQDELQFTNKVMQGIDVIKQTDQKKEQPVKKQNRRGQTMVHYILAAAMTLLLMSTGVFSQMMEFSSSFEKIDLKEEPVSFVNELLNKEISITDKLEESFKEGVQQ